MRVWLVLPLLLLLGCDLNQGRIDAWYANRYAPPGGAAEVELAVHRAIRGQILRVEAASEDLGLPATEVFQNEQAPGFGYLITRTKNEKLVTQRVPVPVPATARPGRAWVTLRVGYRAADYAGPSQFTTHSGQETLRVPVTVVPPGLEWLIRARDALLPMGLLLLVALVCGAVAPKKDQGAWRNAVVVLLWIGWLAGLWVAFARPLAWALGLTAWWARALLVAAGLYGLFWAMATVEALRARAAPPT